MSESWLEMTILVWFQSETSTFSVWHFRFESLWAADLFGVEMGVDLLVVIWGLLVCFIDLFVLSCWWREEWGKDHERRTGTAFRPSADEFGICRSLTWADPKGRDALVWFSSRNCCQDHSGAEGTRSPRQLSLTRVGEGCAGISWARKSLPPVWC